MVTALSVSIAHDAVVRLEFGGPGWWEVARGRGHNLSFVPEYVLDGIQNGRFGVVVAI